MIIQLLAALVGSVGFAMLLNMRGKQVAYAGIGGIISWGIYLLGYQFTESYFIANFVAAVFVALYAEIMARVNRAPATIFLTAAAIPLIPGRNLYLSMYGIVTEDYVNARLNGMTAIVIALAIGLGIVFITVIFKFINRYNSRRNRKNVR
jgi:hypothetical protein